MTNRFVQVAAYDPDASEDEYGVAEEDQEEEKSESPARASDVEQLLPPDEFQNIARLPPLPTRVGVPPSAEWEELLAQYNQNERQAFRDASSDQADRLLNEQEFLLAQAAAGLDAAPEPQTPYSADGSEQHERPEEAEEEGPAKKKRKKKTANPKTDRFKSGKERLDCKYFYITYAHYTGNRVELYDQLKTYFGPARLDFMVVSLEKHHDGTPHAHVVAALYDEMCVKEISYLNVRANRQEWPANAQAATNHKNTLRYILKFDETPWAGFPPFKYKEYVYSVMGQTDKAYMAAYDGGFLNDKDWERKLRVDHPGMHGEKKAKLDVVHMLGARDREGPRMIGWLRIPRKRYRQGFVTNPKWIEEQMNLADSGQCDWNVPQQIPGLQDFGPTEHPYMYLEDGKTLDPEYEPEFYMIPLCHDGRGNTMPVRQPQVYIWGPAKTGKSTLRCWLEAAGFRSFEIPEGKPPDWSGWTNGELGYTICYVDEFAGYASGFRVQDINKVGDGTKTKIKSKWNTAPPYKDDRVSVFIYSNYHRDTIYEKKEAIRARKERRAMNQQELDAVDEGIVGFCDRFSYCIWSGAYDLFGAQFYKFDATTDNFVGEEIVVDMPDPGKWCFQCGQYRGKDKNGASIACKHDRPQPGAAPSERNHIMQSELGRLRRCRVFGPALPGGDSEWF